MGGGWFLGVPRLAFRGPWPASCARCWPGCGVAVLLLVRVFGVWWVLLCQQILCCGRGPAVRLPRAPVSPPPPARVSRAAPAPATRLPRTMPHRRCPYRVAACNGRTTPPAPGCTSAGGRCTTSFVGGDQSTGRAAQRPGGRGSGGGNEKEPEEAGDENVADLHTKYLAKPKMDYLLAKLPPAPAFRKLLFCASCCFP